MKPPVSFNGTENLIQNFSVRFSHTFRNEGGYRFKSMFVIKGASVTTENALPIAKSLFPRFTEIEIESIENDDLTLTPSEYDFLQGVLKDKICVNKSKIDYVETDYDKYLETLIKKMRERMDQFPVYHT